MQLKPNCIQLVFLFSIAPSANKTFVSQRWYERRRWQLSSVCQACDRVKEIITDLEQTAGVRNSSCNSWRHGNFVCKLACVHLRRICKPLARTSDTPVGDREGTSQLRRCWRQMTLDDTSGSSMWQQWRGNNSGAPEGSPYLNSTPLQLHSIVTQLLHSYYTTSP